MLGLGIYMLMPLVLGSNHIPVFVSLEHSVSNDTVSQLNFEVNIELHTCALTMLAVPFKIQLAYAFRGWVDLIV